MNLYNEYQPSIFDGWYFFYAKSETERRILHIEE